jgi:hypothetical protein
LGSRDDERAELTGNRRVRCLKYRVDNLCSFSYMRNGLCNTDDGNRAMTTKADRSELSRALAKAIAYRDCGKPEKAAAWAAQLVRMLEAKAILKPEYADAQLEG